MLLSFVVIILSLSLETFDALRLELVLVAISDHCLCDCLLQKLVVGGRWLAGGW